MRINVLRCLAVAVLLSGLAGCATAKPGDLAATDKFPKFNHAMLDFNIALDKNVLKPASEGYAFVMPTLFKHLIRNGFNHLELPGDFINFLLQGEIHPALETLGRFTINTLMGGGGLLDPATEMGLPKQDTNFGITLGKHGVEEGSYLVLPFMGPKTVRGAFGSIVDKALDPLTYLGQVAPSASPEAGIALTVTDKVDQRYRNADVINELLYKSSDPYVTLRSVYLQHLRSEVGGSKGGAAALPDIFDQQSGGQSQQSGGQKKTAPSGSGQQQKTAQ